MPIRNARPVRRINSYSEAFEVVLKIEISEKLFNLLKKLESEGHTEKSICFSICKAYRELNENKENEKSFLELLEESVNKWSWKKDDPRWQEYWKKKEEQEKAKELRDQLFDTRYGKKRKEKEYDGYIYFIQGLCGGAIKIGYSQEPIKRLNQLQTGYPDTLTILMMIPGNKDLEQQLHEEFYEYKLKGEWFKPDPYLINKMKEMKKQ